jgi:peptidoglycan/LPS O-acetylase OafA/YrhL
MAGGLQAERLDVLDAFRALAIFAVMMYHYLWCWAPPSHARDLYGYHRVYSHWLALGSLGVQFFFMISGFVILMTLGRCRSLPEFWVRRFARLYPAYFVVIVISFIVTNRFGPNEFQSTTTDLFTGLAFLSPDFTKGTFVDLSFWSLVVEVQFYFWIGIVYMAAKKHFVVAWIVLVSVGILCWLLSGMESLHVLKFVRHPLFLLPHIAHFTAGMAFYQLFMRRRTGGALMLVSLLAYAVVTEHSGWPRHAATALMVVAFLAFLSGRLNWLARQPLLFVGEISYSLYLVHQNLGIILIARLTRAGVPDLLSAAAAASLSLAFAYALTRAVEVPAKRLLLNWASAAAAPRAI